MLDKYSWQSDCHLLRHKCNCREEGLSLDNCADAHLSMKIDYYGECKQLDEGCTQDILQDFPRRMREWLHQVMR